MSQRSPKTASPVQDPEAFIRDNFNAAREGMERSVKDATDFTQRNPEKALLWAFGSGYVLRMLPLAEIFGAIIRVLLSLLKPAALIYGSIKILQQAQTVVSLDRSTRTSRTDERSATGR
jgi:hypothetical protein